MAPSSAAGVRVFSCSGYFSATPSTGTVGYFSSGWPVAYLVATVIFGIGLLIGSLVHVSQPVAGCQAIRPVSPSRLAALADAIVGRITGMVDCSGTKRI